MAAKEQRVNRRSPWIVVALVLCAFALRVYRLDFVSLRGDESFTVLFAAEPLPQLLEGIRNVEPNPPFYYFLLRGALLLLGQSGFSARYVSAIFGVLAIPLLYQLGRALMPASRVGPLIAQPALLAALFLAINPYQIWQSQDVRNYTLWPALSLASLYLMLRALRENRKSFWIGYAVTALLSLYTHYYDVFVLLFENAFVFLCTWRDRPLLKRWLIAQVILAVLYLPWPLFASSRPFSYEDLTANVPGILGIVERSLSVFTLGETVPQIVATVLLPVWLLLLALGLASAFRRDRHVFAFLLLYLAVPTLCIFLLTQWRPFFRERYLNVIAPAYYLTFALGLAALVASSKVTHLRWGRALVAVGLGALVIPAGFSLGHYYFDPHYAKSPDWRGLAAYLEAQAGPDDVIIQNYPDPTLAYYYHGSSERVILPQRSAVDQVGDLRVNRMATGKALQQLLAEHRRLWLLPYQSEWDPQGFVESWLNRRARKVQEEQVDAFRVVAYEREETPSASIQYPMVSRLGEGIELLGYDLAADAGCEMLEAGDATPERLTLHAEGCILHLTLYWRAWALMDIGYTVFTHLLGPDGQIQAQQDNQPQGGAFPTLEWFPGDVIPDEYALAVPADAPPGGYALEVGMYRLETRERLPAYDADGRQWPEDAIRLALPIQVMP
jgi:4-amino-4-deoxy-L-arabinose transferase-like glycosyltransferase